MSSVIQGFEPFREGARRAIERVGGEPVLVNEDLPSVSASSRNACIDGVDSSDVFVLLIGPRGGWKTPSGKLVIEEELERAKKRKIPVLVFVQDCKLDSEAERLGEAVSDYVEGYFREDVQDP